MQDKETIISKIQKLLALSQSNNPNEAALALSKAQKLLQEHNLSAAEVQIKSGVKSEYIQRFFMMENNETWRRDLMILLARFNFCRLLFWEKLRKVVLIGEAENIEAIHLMFLHIYPQLERLALSSYQTYKRAGGDVHAKTFKANFYRGALHTIRVRLHEEQAAFEASSNSCRALIIVKDTDLKEATERFYPKITAPHKRRPTKAPDGLSQGREAGKQVRFRKEVK